jgi:hypothetical protein
VLCAADAGREDVAVAASLDMNCLLEHATG